MRFIFLLLLSISSTVFASSGILQVSSIYIDAETQEARRVVGTGLSFNHQNKSYFLTASHVVSGDNIVIQDGKQTLEIEKTTYINRVTDVALFELKNLIKTPFQIDSTTLKITGKSSEFTGFKFPTLAMDNSHFVPVLHASGKVTAYNSPTREGLSFSNAENSSKNRVTETLNGLELRAYGGIRPGMSGSPLLELDQKNGLVLVKGITTSYNNFFKISYFSKVENALSAFFPQFAVNLDLDAQWNLVKTGFFRIFSNGYSENKVISNRAGNSLIIQNNLMKKEFQTKGLKVIEPTNLIDLKKIDSNSQFKFDPKIHIDNTDSKINIDNTDPKKKIDPKNLYIKGGVRSDGGGDTQAKSDAPSDPQVSYDTKKSPKYNTSQFSLFLNSSDASKTVDVPASWYRFWKDLGLIKNGQHIIGFNVYLKDGFNIALLANENSLIFLSLQKDKISRVEKIYLNSNLSTIAAERWERSRDPETKNYYGDRKLSYCHVMAMSLAEGEFDISVNLFSKKGENFWNAFPIMSFANNSLKVNQEHPYPLIEKRTLNGKYVGDDYDITGLYFTDLSLFDKAQNIHMGNRMYLYFSSKSMSVQGGEGKLYCETDKRIK